MNTRPEALRLADELEEAAGEYWRFQKSTGYGAAAELRRLHAERAAADGVINDLVAKVRELQKENESLAAALASSCDEQRHELWESGGIAGCERARVAERQRDALLAEHQQTLALQQRSYEREIQLEVEAEREACAKLCEDYDDDRGTGETWGPRFAALIRARDNPPENPSW